MSLGTSAPTKNHDSVLRHFLYFKVNSVFLGCNHNVPWERKAARGKLQHSRADSLSAQAPGAAAQETDTASSSGGPHSIPSSRNRLRNSFDFPSWGEHMLSFAALVSF